MSSEKHPSIVKLSLLAFYITTLLLASGIIYFAISQSPWWLLALPFLWISSCCSVPNLNLANSCLPILCATAGGILYLFHTPSGSAIVLGSITGFYINGLVQLLILKAKNDYC